MNSNTPDFIQAPATVYLGDAPQAGVVYESRGIGGEISQYCIGTGERMKNGKYVVRLHDVNNRASYHKKVTKAGMDAAWFRSFKRSEIVPARVYELLTAVK